MAYASPAGKRQKVREGRSVDNVEYFQGIDKLEYNASSPAPESLCYRHYNPSERVHSRSMDEWLKCSVSLTEFRGYAYDTWTKPSHRPWDDITTSLDHYKRCIKAFFELCSKLGARYWTAFDSDLVPWAEWDECRTNWDEMVEYIQEAGQKYHVKLLWLAPDLHSHAKYTTGALSSNDASTFLQASVQIKKCLEVSHKLNAECFLIWPLKDGYDFIFHTDIIREMKLMAKLLKMTAEYKDRLSFRCQLLIMPYSENNSGYVYGSGMNMQHREAEIYKYMWDVTSCLYFLKNYNLDRFYKVCVPPGHHMYMANVYNMLGGVTITNSLDHYNLRTISLMMKCIVDQGSAPPAGINLRLFPQRDFDAKELVCLYVKYIDSIAKGIRAGCGVVSEQLFNKHVQQRYISYHSGVGSRLAGNDVTLEECEEYYKKNAAQHSTENTNKSQHADIVFQRYIDTCEHL